MKSKRPVFPILMILFLGFLGFSLALPILPPLILEKNSGFLPDETSHFARNVILGLLLSMYPAGQFFGCPIIGKLSDRFGRKKILLISIAATAPVYALTAIAISQSYIFLLFFARFLSGLLEGNITIAQAAMTDIAETKREKSRLFSWGVAATSSAFIIGPLIGGKLADPTLVHWFSYSTPFWLAAGFLSLTFVYLLFRFEETGSTRTNTISIFRSIYEGFKRPSVYPIYKMNLIVFIAIFFFFGFLPVYLVKKFGMAATKLAEAEAYLSVPIAIAPFLEGHLSKRFSPLKATIYSSFFLGIGMLFLLPFPSKWALLVTLIPPGLSIAWALTYTNVMISEGVGEDEQGQALGINQSLQVLSEAGTSLIGGFLAAHAASLPLIVGAFFAIGGSAIFWNYKRKYRLD